MFRLVSASILSAKQTSSTSVLHQGYTDKPKSFAAKFAAWVTHLKTEAEAEVKFTGYVTVMKTQPDNCSETKALGANGRMKGHKSLYSYISTRVTQSISHHSPLQWLFETALPPQCLIYVHSRHQINYKLESGEANLMSRAEMVWNAGKWGEWKNWMCEMSSN